MTRTDTVRTQLLVAVGEMTNRTLAVPVVVFFPTSRCNSRCVSCDWWRASGSGDLSIEEIARLADALPGIGTRMVLFSGGEPLLRPEVFDGAALFLARGMVLHLHTSGVLLERSAAAVAEAFSRVIVSLDAATEADYKAIRGIAALTTIERGVARLRKLNPDLPVTARATLHRHNFRELGRLIDHARATGFDGISFLAADVLSSAFGRAAHARTSTLALTAADVQEFRRVVDDVLVTHAHEFACGFVAESPAKLRRLPQYYAAMIGQGDFPPVECNAPYMSVVIEADGAVRPCFFHEAIGNVRLASLDSIVRRNLAAFRSDLEIASNPVCRRCVCSKRTGWRSQPWA
jgi:MoaA/NifB/PqqE/SkfB family radical SAM enzyme